MAQVLTANPHENASPFSPSRLAHSSAAPPSPDVFFMPPSSHSDSHTTGSPDNVYSRASSAPSSPQAYRAELSRSSSFHSTPPSSLSLNAPSCDDELSLPSYGADEANYTPQHNHSRHDQGPVNTREEDASGTDDPDAAAAVMAHVADDTEVKEEPTRQVDYLSHEWKEEDISCSWKYIVSRRKEYGERSRLENASWRTWTKSKYNLKTVSPERLNWLKDCDVTWLYGPLSQAHGRKSQFSEPPSRLSKSNSFVGGIAKKSNLKKRSVSEVMLSKSISTSSLVKQAAAAVEAQRRYSSRASYNRAGTVDYEPSLPTSSTTVDFSDPFTSASTSTSGLQSPGEQRRHIRFDHKVEQCIAVDFSQNEDEVPEAHSHKWDHALYSASSSDDDHMPTMKAKSRPIRTASRTPSSRNSTSSESKGIAKLPSTTLRFHADETEAESFGKPIPSPQSPYLPSRPSGPSPALDKSPSQETLRPSRPSHNFLIDQASEESEGFDWTPGGAFPSSESSDSHWSAGSARHASSSSATTVGRVATGEESGGLRRTGSGMFMPFEGNEDDEEHLVGNSVFGRVVDSVNTARDIAHVIWNVGWRK